MATFIMLPDGVTGTNQWQNPAGGACAAYNVDNDNGGTDYCYEHVDSHEITFTLAAPSVSSGAIDSITSVQVMMSAAFTAASGIDRILSYQTGTGISNGNSNHIVTAGGSYANYAGTAETTSDGSTAWTYTDLGNLQIKLDKYGASGGRTNFRVSYLYAEVTYVEAVGYGHAVLGVAAGSIGKVNSVSTANLGKVIGVD